MAERHLVDVSLEDIGEVLEALRVEVDFVEAGPQERRAVLDVRRQPVVELVDAALCPVLGPATGSLSGASGASYGLEESDVRAVLGGPVLWAGDGAVEEARAPKDDAPRWDVDGYAAREQAERVLGLVEPELGDVGAGSDAGVDGGVDAGELTEEFGAMCAGDAYERCVGVADLAADLGWGSGSGSSAGSSGEGVQVPVEKLLFALPG